MTLTIFSNVEAQSDKEYKKYLNQKMTSSSFRLINFYRQPTDYKKKKEYKYGQVIGVGTFGIVRKAYHDVYKHCAIKIVPKTQKANLKETVALEIAFLSSLSHDNIIKLFDYFESKKKYYIVTQQAKGGELFDYLSTKGSMTESETAHVIHQVLDAVRYLHSLNIVHRDLKPENLLFLDNIPTSRIAIADFGIAKRLLDGGYLKSAAGSQGYIAPEVIKKQKYGKAVDLWAIGIITYTMLCGYRPFKGSTKAISNSNAVKGNVIFHEGHWSHISTSAKEFIKALLNPNPNSRPTAEEALNNHWLLRRFSVDYNEDSSLKKELSLQPIRHCSASNYNDEPCQLRRTSTVPLQFYTIKQPLSSSTMCH